MGDNQDFWTSHTEAWKASEQTQASCCREHQLSRASVHYWRRKRKMQAKLPAKGMIPIIPPAVAGGTLLEIAPRNGLTLRAPLAAEPERIAAWVQALASC